MLPPETFKKLSSAEEVIVSRELKELLDSLGALSRSVKHERELPQEMTRKVLLGLENRVALIAGIAEVGDNTLAADPLTERIQELEAQLASRGSTNLRDAIALCCDCLDHWWEAKGFGGLASFESTRAGTFKVVLRVSPYSSEPEKTSDKHATWEQSFQAMGLQVLYPRGEPRFQDDAPTREAIARLLAAHLPSARITQTANQWIDDQPYLSTVTVSVRDIEEARQLD
ncbi:hypothetical protein LC612_30835 [Nostoc sp. CHAB 5834]|nr:hypothetical protein [Nostoc sp. CHAB 5834]